MGTYKLSPSYIASLYPRCKRCFWVKVKASELGFSPPPGPILPKVFNKMDSMQKAFAKGQDVEVFNILGFTGGRVVELDFTVNSLPLKVRNSTFYISGMGDFLIKWNDGSYGVWDFKTTTPTEATVGYYRHQILAYAFALKHASSGYLKIENFGKSGILACEPLGMVPHPEGWSIEGQFHALEVELKWPLFENRLDKIAELVEGKIPERNDYCEACNYSGNWR